ncbi:MarR family winged helix-turn-helix transcriptional regulator [Actinomycetospora sp. NBRC 106375]|uniref:MarR family winged helix-turn-helix transcriptional regulator n=1 Tax=Actinomycetospora sp. NBRC 106375 TaxID=3032207 RepID=UPI00255449FB|nr:MarR family winged helix-turn-helix transcriptional regulator [Actinomycetospora sp. NBRC 106375]
MAEAPLTGEEETVLRALPAAIRALLRRWDADLEATHGLSHVEYTVLRLLSESDGRACQLARLAEGAQQSLSAVGRTVGRLEADGLVTRRPAARDGRATEAVLTDAGLERLRAAWPDLLASVRRSFFDHLGDVDLDALGRALTEIAETAARRP